MREELKKERWTTWLIEILDWVKENKKAPQLGIPSERIYANRLYRMRKSRKYGSHENFTWDIEHENILSQYDLVQLFEIPILYNSYMSFELLLDWVEEHGKTPNQNPYQKNDTYERYLGRKLSCLRRTKKNIVQKKNMRHTMVWYSEYDKILKRRKMEWVFEFQTTTQKVQELADWIKKHNRNPHIDSNGKEYILHIRLMNLRSSKKGKSSLNWKPEYDKIFKTNGLGCITKVNEQNSFENLILWINENGVPNYSKKNSRELRSNRNRIDKYRTARYNGPSGYVWKPEYEALIEKYNLVEVFSARK